MSVIRVTDLDLKGKRVFIRADLNVPVKDGKVTSDARISASMGTIDYCLKQGGKVMVTSHLGRPEEGVAPGRVTLFSLSRNAGEGWREGKVVRGLIRPQTALGFPVESRAILLQQSDPCPVQVLPWPRSGHRD